MTWWTKSKKATAAAFDTPRPGMMFHEHLCFVVIVVAVDGDRVTTVEGSPPCTLPDGGRWHERDIADFRAAFSYGNIPGYWVTLEERTVDVTGWLADRIAGAELAHCMDQ